MRIEKRNVESETQKLLDKEAKTQKYIENLTQDLRDSEAERRQLVKIIDRYSAVRVRPRTFPLCARICARPLPFASELEFAWY